MSSARPVTNGHALVETIGTIQKKKKQERIDGGCNVKIQVKHRSSTALKG